jgi:hypothetical protein
MVWVDPTWVYPQAASNALKNFTWLSTIENVLFKDTGSADDAERFLLDLWAEVKSENLWQDPYIKEQVSFNLTMVRLKLINLS